MMSIRYIKRNVAIIHYPWTDNGLSRGKDKGESGACGYYLDFTHEKLSAKMSADRENSWF